MNQPFYRGMTPHCGLENTVEIWKLELDLPKDRLMEAGTAISKIGTLAQLRSRNLGW